MTNPTVTINIAGPGTQLSNGKTSTAGHMWYEISDGNGNTYSFGFAQLGGYQGEAFAPGDVYDDDNVKYLSTRGSKTLDITQEQFDALLSFGLQPNAEGYNFNSSKYNVFSNSCIDFVWTGLQVAGILPYGSYDGDLLPAANINEVNVLGNPFVTDANDFANNLYRDALATEGLNDAIVNGDGKFIYIEEVRDENGNITSQPVLILTETNSEGQTIYRPITYPYYDPSADNPEQPNTATIAKDIFQNATTEDPDAPEREPGVPTPVLKPDAVSVWNGSTDSFDHFKVTDSTQISNLARSFGLEETGDTNQMLVDKLLGVAENGSWSERELTNPDGSTQYVYKTQDGDLALTPVDNDFGYVSPSRTYGYANYNPEADNPNFDGVYLSTGESVMDAYVNDAVSRASSNFEGNGKNLKSPLVLDLDGDGIETTHAYDSNVQFDIDNDQFAERVGWVSSDDGLLAMDRDGNGNIDNITELYGDDVMPAFEKLAQHDSNNDGKIDANDADYNNLLVWRDLNQNGISEEGELYTLAETGIKEISLSETQQDIWQNENYISSNSTYTWNDGRTDEIADVHFLNDNINTWFKGAHSQVFGSDIKVNFEAVLMPLSRGYGSLPSLHIAMTYNPLLMQMVKDVVAMDATDIGIISERITDILYEWAGVRFNDPNARTTGNGNNIDARQVDFLEQFTGIEWDQLGASGIVGIGASVSVKKAWNEILEMMTGRILVQGAFKEIFPDSIYFFQNDSMQLGSSMSEIISNATNYIASNPEGAHEFWLKIANILIAHKGELGASVSDINNAVSTAYGEELYIGEQIITADDGAEIYSKTDGVEETLLISTRVGDNNANNIDGSEGNDYVFAEGGNDTINGNGGDDYVDAGSGDDAIDGGAGNDYLRGGDGNDSITGGTGRDALYGGDGEDNLQGGDGQDKLQGGKGADIIDGGAGADEIDYYTSDSAVYVNLKTGQSFGGDAAGDTFTNIENATGSGYDDVLVGDNNSNLLHGEEGDDILKGGRGNDVLFGADGNDELYGEEGNDTLQAHNGAELLDGGEGFDKVIYDDPRLEEGVHVNLAEARGYSGAAEGDRFVSIENVHGTTHNDILVGDSNDNILAGLEGNDVLKGGAGDDVLNSGGGFDHLYGGSGNDIFLVAKQKDSITYIHDYEVGNNNEQISLIAFDLDALEIQAEGNDTIIHVGQQRIVVKNTSPSDFSLSDFGFNENSNVTSLTIIAPETLEANNINGTNLDNELVGTFANDNIDGGNGSDHLYGSHGNDTLNGGSGDDHLYGGVGADNLNGGDGIDVAYYDNSYEGVNVNLSTNSASGGTATGDTFNSVEALAGSQFNDTLSGDNNDNVIYGLNGNDVINGKGGNNILVGGQGNDTYVIEQHSGQGNVISDFDITNPNEKIDLSAFNISQLTIIRMGDNGQDAQINLGSGQYLLLEGLGANALTSNNFIFAPGANPSIFTQVQGDGGNNVLFGGDANEEIHGLGGADYFASGKGNDVIYSNESGYDIFDIAKDNGSIKTVYNFQHYTHNWHWISGSLSSGGLSLNASNKVQGNEFDNGKFDLSDFANVRSFSDLNIYTSGSDTHVGLGNGQELVLKNYQHGAGGILSHQSGYWTPPGGSTEYGNMFEVLSYQLKSSNFTFYNGTLTGTYEDNVLDGGYGSDNIIAGDGDDILNGEGDNDTLDGGRGKDILDGGAGNDNMTGGAGGDTFVVTRQSGTTDTITDFEFWRPDEKIDLTAFNGDFTNFAAFKNNISQQGNDAVINLGSGQTIVLKNVDAANLGRENFIGAVANNTNPTTSGLNLDIQEAYANNEFILTIDANVFADIDGDHLDFTATLGDGSELPAWLTFDAETQTFSGTPDASDADDLTIVVTASDGDASVSSSFDVSIRGTFYATGSKQAVAYTEDTDATLDPIAVTSTSDAVTVNLTLSDNNAGSFVTGTSGLVTSTFVNGVWTASGSISDVNALLASLVFTPSENFNGDFDINVAIDDGVESPINTVMNVTGTAVNDNPDAVDIDTNVDEDNTAVIDVLASSSDVDGDSLAIDSVTQGTNGSVSIVDGTIHYTPVENFAGTDSFDYTVSDGNGATVTRTINITVNAVNDAPIVAQAVADQAALENQTLSFQFDIGVFTDVEGDALTYSATLADGSDLPSWLTFDPATRTFSGTPVRGHAGNVNVKVTANDGQVQTSTNFVINVAADDYTGQTILGEDVVAANEEQLHETLNAESFELVDLGGDGKLDIVGDFGTDGLWLYDQQGGWGQLLTNNPDSIQVVDFTGDGVKDIVTDFGDVGLWYYNTAANSWNQILTNNVESFKVIDFNGNGLQNIIADIGGLGLYKYDPATGWTAMITNNPESFEVVDFNGDGQQDLIVDLGSIGLWNYDQATNSWNQLLTNNVEQSWVLDFNGDGNKNIIADLGTIGLWMYTQGTGWSQLDPEDAQKLEFVDFNGDGQTDIVGDFSSGLWVYDQAQAAWIHYLTNDVDNFEVADINNDGQQDIVADVGQFGLYVYDQAAGSWNQIITSDVENFTVEDFNGDGGQQIVIDKGADGVLMYNAEKPSDDELFGTELDDTIEGKAGNDTLHGGDGYDTIRGGEGDDIIDGGAGIDDLYGDEGADVFIFNDYFESVQNARDTIHDFVKGEDFINLVNLGITSIDDLNIAQDGDSTIVSANNNDFEVEIVGQHSLDEADFILA